MNNIMLILTGVLLTVVASLMGLVLIPSWQFQEMGPIEIAAVEGESSTYPASLSEIETAGRKQYQSLGCIYCHSQQVRPENFGADIDRGWGQRRSVPRDYVLQDPPLMGTMRTGPDLANIGFRQPDMEWHYLHLFDPVITSEGSMMPRHRFLFEVQLGSLSSDFESGVSAFQLPKSYYDEDAWIVPSERASALVAYLKSLNQKYDLEVVK